MQNAAITVNPHQAGHSFVGDRNRRAIYGIYAGFAIALLVGSMSVLAQLPGSNTGSNSGQTTGQTSGHGGGFGRLSPFPNDDPDYDPAMTERRVRALNAERQKQMIADANKLLKLAKELNDQVASANENSFTADQLRKIAEIEKLAKNVRERMTAGIGDAGNQFSPPSVVYPVH
jgi:hypothetical protein